MKKPARFPWIWIVPLAAAIAAGLLVLNSLRQLGPGIIITFRDGTGLISNQTIVKYRGVRIGSVRSVHLSKDARQVEVGVRLDRSATALARSGSSFWVVRPEVGAGGFHGLETIVTGPYIQVQPGNGNGQPENGQPQKQFTGLEEPPVLPSTRAGTEFILTSPGVASLAEGSPVYYRGVEVGSVEYLALTQNSAAVEIHALIYAKFAQLIRTNSVFWNAGGISVNLHFLGIGFSAENFKSLIIGGIAFATPNDFGPPATAGMVFPLNEKADKKWLDWAPTISVTNATQTAPANNPVSPLGIKE
jgi:paraquat-inducible protein B